eukprot:TRINITY_DN30903_c0_g1_i2.p1 TRINITY_DN30903_c0_g1~~TRINITY_DN30903_c0_g1_i2.p1  ORF type:complete len:503 (-),score=98.23 TRINITY_DN30903_c0_g1_i2:530-2038(-)
MELQQRSISILVINGAEPAKKPKHEQLAWSAMVADVLVAHPSVGGLVLTAHGGCPDVHLRRVVETSRGCPVLLYSAIDNRCVENHEAHEAPWSLMCPRSWFLGSRKPRARISGNGRISAAAAKVFPSPYLTALAMWAGTLQDEHLERVLQPPCPRRYAGISVEIFDRPAGDSAGPGRPFALGESRLEDLDEGFSLWKSAEDSAASSGARCDNESVWDIYFDARTERMDIMLRNVADWSLEQSLSDVLQKDGPFARRLLRFFRITSAKNVQDLQGNELHRNIAVQELLALNKNLGNFMWLLAPAVATFGDSAVEVVVEMELGRVQSPYNGYKEGHAENEWRLNGKSSSSPLYADGHLELMPSNVVDYYERRLVKTGDGRPPPRSRQQQYSGWRFDIDGVVWFSSPADDEDLEHVQQGQVRNDALQACAGLRERPGEIFVVPEGMLPASFLAKHGHRVRRVRAFQPGCLEAVQRNVHAGLSRLRPHMPMSTDNVVVQEVLQLRT